MKKLLLYLLGPENANFLAVSLLHWGYVLRFLRRKPLSYPSLCQNISGLHFGNPLGMAAGFDKNAIGYKGLFHFGFASAEVGTVLRFPYKGNDGKRRVHRLEQDEAVINRYGLPSEGMDKVSQRLQKRKRNKQGQVVGVNIGAHPESKDIFTDYSALAKKFANHADYLTLNVSCPNVTTHANFQSPEFLPKILQSVQQGLKEANYTRPYLLKLSPDLEPADLKKIVDIAFEYQVSGLIMGNTTTTRKGLQSEHKNEIGGLSGKPLFALSTAKLAELYLLCEGKLPLIGVGGIDSAETAYAKIKAGASLLQLYTGLVYHGPQLIKQILTQLPFLLKADGYNHIGQAVGCEAKKYASHIAPLKTLSTKTASTPIASKPSEPSPSSVFAKAS